MRQPWPRTNRYKIHTAAPNYPPLQPRRSHYSRPGGWEVFAVGYCVNLDDVQSVCEIRTLKNTHWISDTLSRRRLMMRAAAIMPRHNGGEPPLRVLRCVPDDGVGLRPRTGAPVITSTCLRENCRIELPPAGCEHNRRSSEAAIPSVLYCL